MSANQERLQGAHGGSCNESKPRTDQDACGQANDLEQARHDLFSEAVRQALARQTGAMKKQQNGKYGELERKKEETETKKDAPRKEASLLIIQRLAKLP